MREMSNNFNSVAFIYDFMAQLVFGKAILKAQSGLLHTIPDSSSVLILGGGTGFILEELDKLSLPLSVTYVEPSSAMIRRAKARSPFNCIEVDFIQDRHEAVLGADRFDVVITNFFLDVFTREQLPEVVRQVSSLTADNGMWLLTDFVITGVWWQKVLVKIMYLFFRVTARLEGDQLLNFNDYLSKTGFTSVKSESFYHGMISSHIFKRI